MSKKANPYLRYIELPSYFFLHTLYILNTQIDIGKSKKPAELEPDKLVTYLIKAKQSLSNME